MTNVETMIAGYLVEADGGEIDQHKRRVLERIAADCHAHEALNIIGKDSDLIWQLIGLCIDAELRMRTFHELLSKERDMVERLRRHRESVEDLKQFIDQATEHHEHPFVDWLALPKKDQESAELWDQLKRGASIVKQPLPPNDGYEKSADYYRGALDRIAALIDERQRSAEEAERMLGANREFTTRLAAENAAIGWLAEHVVDLTGKPFTAQVARLAEIVLGLNDVSEDRVRSALKARRKTGQLGPKKLLE